MIKKSPSRLHRLMNCPASGRLSENVPEFTNPAALKGREAHSIVLGALQKEDPALAAGTEYAAHADFLYSIIAGVEKFEVERFLPALQLLGMALEGREGEHQADLIYWHEGVLHVLDYKSGSEPVRPEWNEQLQSYAWAYCTEEDVWPENIILEIYQPKISLLIQGWSSSGGSLRKFGIEVKQLMELLEEAKGFQEGQWCKWCPAKSICPLKTQAQQERKENLDMIKAEGAQALATLPPKEIGEEVSVSGEAIALAKKLRDEVEALQIQDAVTEEKASGMLKQITTYEKQAEEACSIQKEPLIRRRKAIDETFQAWLLTPLEEAKKALKAKLVRYRTELDEKREAELKAQRMEQERLELEARKLAEKAEKAKTESAKEKLRLQAEEAAKKAAEASIVKPVEAPSKPSGLSMGTAYTVRIENPKLIPARYQLIREQELVIDKKTAYAILEIDGALLLKDAAEGRLEGAKWCQVSSIKTVKAGK